jgi:hypothetical protein
LFFARAPFTYSKKALLADCNLDDGLGPDGLQLTAIPGPVIGWL